MKNIIWDKLWTQKRYQKHKKIQFYTVFCTNCHYKPDLFNMERRHFRHKWKHKQTFPIFFIFSFQTSIPEVEAKWKGLATYWTTDGRTYGPTDIKLKERCTKCQSKCQKWGNYWVTQRLPQIYTAKLRNLPNTETQNYRTDLR